MEKKDIDWSNIGFGYYQTDERYVSNFKNGAWDDGVMTKDANVVMNECAGVLQDRKSTRLNSSHNRESRMPSSA